MIQYIDKAVILEKIEKLKKEWSFGSSAEAKYKVEAYKELIDFLDTLKVKDVNLEKEYEEFVVDDPILGNFITNDTMGMILAKHFFELGLKAKGE